MYIQSSKMSPYIHARISIDIYAFFNYKLDSASWLADVMMLVILFLSRLTCDPEVLAVVNGMPTWPIDIQIYQSSFVSTVRITFYIMSKTVINLQFHKKFDSIVGFIYPHFFIRRCWIVFILLINSMSIFYQNHLCGE